jgi:hypothetical protein
MKTILYHLNTKVHSKFVILLLIVSALLFVDLSQLSAADYGLGGRWRGTWTSQSTGHHGPLKARFQPQSNGSVRAVFSGRFAVIIPFRYSMNLQPTLAEDGTVWLSGSKKLGPLLGSYDFAAQSDGCTLNAGYSAGKDQGNFYLRRSR